MDPALEQLGWTEDQWNRICTTVTEEAQRARVGAQILPVVGPEDPSTVAVPRYSLAYPARAVPPPAGQIVVSSDPRLYLTTISVLVELGGREAADPTLAAALTMFRRAANVVALAEDALVFNGRSPAAIRRLRPRVRRILGTNPVPTAISGLLASRNMDRIFPPQGSQQIVQAIFTAIGNLDAAGYSGPYACALDQAAFVEICTPSVALILPRDRILPFLNGGSLVRASSIPRSPFGQPTGIVIALSGNPVELVVATDIHVNYLQTTAATEPRHVFRISERVALRVKDWQAVRIIM
jgi:uncharacterized linocin/CFP29 family protein